MANGIGQIVSTGTGLLGGVMTGGIVIIAILIMCGTIVGTAFYIRWLRQFNIFVEIVSTRSGQGQKTIFDRAAYVYDKKDKSWYFRIKNMKVDLPSPPFNVLQNSSKGNMIKIWQKSNEEFVFLMPDKINQEVIVKQDGRSYPASEMEMKQVEGDVSYWNQIRKRGNRKLFDPESMIMKLLPYIIPVLMFMLVIFLTWIVVKKFDVLADVANQLKLAAEAIRSTTTATVTTST